MLRNMTVISSSHMHAGMHAYGPTDMFFQLRKHSQKWTMAMLNIASVLCIFELSRKENWKNWFLLGFSHLRCIGINFQQILAGSHTKNVFVAKIMSLSWNTVFVFGAKNEKYIRWPLFETPETIFIVLV